MIGHSTVTSGSVVYHSNSLCFIQSYMIMIITIKWNKLLNLTCAQLIIVHYWLCICPDAVLTGYPWWCVAGMPMYPPPVRRRTNSLGSGNDGLDEGRHPEGRHPDARHPEARHPEARHPEGRHPEGRHPEPYERDPRMWLERGYMPPPPGKWAAWPNTLRLSLRCLSPFPWLTVHLHWAGQGQSGGSDSCSTTRATFIPERVCQNLWKDLYCWKMVFLQMFRFAKQVLWVAR